MSEAIDTNAEIMRLRELVGDLAHTLTAASHALRSYQYFNSSTELAEEIADQCDEALKRAGHPMSASAAGGESTRPA